MIAGCWALACPEGPLQPLPERQQLVAIGLAAGMLVLVVELVRRRRLREEYAWVWLAVALALLGLALTDGFLLWLSRLIGAATSTSTLFFGCLLFLLLLSLQFSVRLSRLKHRQRTLAQRLALLEQELERAQPRRPEVQPGIRPLRPPPPPERERRAKDETA